MDERYSDRSEIKQCGYFQPHTELLPHLQSWIALQHPQYHASSCLPDLRLAPLYQALSMFKLL